MSAAGLSEPSACEAGQVMAAMKGCDLGLVRLGVAADMIAGCHTGLGTVMLHELGWSVEDIVALVRQTLAESVD